MHFPVELALGPVRLPVHLLCEMLAYTLGYRLYARLRTRTRDPISTGHRQWIFIGAAAGALLGSRALGLLEHLDLLAHPPGGWLYYFTNKTIVGGFLGGLVGVELVKIRLGVRASSGDLMVFPLLLGLSIGRLGCFLSGLADGTFGTATALPRGSTDARLWLAVVSDSLFVCMYLVNNGLAIFSDSAEARRPHWLSLLLVLLIGFGTCAIQFAA